MEAKQEINWNITAIDQLYHLAEGWVDESLLHELHALKQKAQEQRFYLVMVGSFKRGKSSLINAMLGAQLAPVAVVPLTALITLFEYANEAYAKVHFLHQPPQSISFSQIDEYVTEEKNPQNIKQVAYVEVGYPAELLRGMSIVDTPGIGSIFEHNTQTTISFIPKIDAALFVLSADTPISKVDLEFLQALYQQVPKILFVLNKADLLPDDELQKMLQYNRRQVELAIGKQNFIWEVVSSKQADGKYAIHSLIQQLHRLLQEEKSQIIEKSLQNQYRLLHHQIAMQLRLQKETLLMPVAELEKKQQQLEQSLLRMQNQKAEFESLVNGRIKSIQQQVDKSIQSLTQQWREQLQQKYIYQADHTWTEILQQGMVTYQEQQTYALIQSLEQVKKTLEQNTREQFRELLEEYASRSQSFLQELTQYLHSLLGIDFHLIANRFDLDVYTSFYFDYGKGLSVQYLSSPFWIKWLPANLRKKYYLRKLYDHYQQLITINASGMIYDLQYKIQESFRKFNYDLHEHLHQLIHRIQEIIQETWTHRAQSASHIQDRVDALETRLVQLSQHELA
ncbi:MAG: dynamin family protein [Thermoflavifilum sp.]|nr:dynamin family protein [Thermoflavifilum sp.]